MIPSLHELKVGVAAIVAEFLPEILTSPWTRSDGEPDDAEEETPFDRELDEAGAQPPQQLGALKRKRMEHSFGALVGHLDNDLSDLMSTAYNTSDIGIFRRFCLLQAPVDSLLGGNGFKVRFL